MEIIKTKQYEDVEWQEIHLTVRELVLGFKDGGKDNEITAFNGKIILKHQINPDIDKLDVDGKGRETVIWALKEGVPFDINYAYEQEDGRWLLLSGHQILLVTCRYAVNCKDENILNKELNFILVKGDSAKALTLFETAISTQNLL